MKKVVDFNAFAMWYTGENFDIDGVIEYFDDCLGYDVREFIGKEVELSLADEKCNGNYIFLINGCQLVLDAVVNYFECL